MAFTKHNTSNQGFWRLNKEDGGTIAGRVQVVRVIKFKKNVIFRPQFKPLTRNWWGLWCFPVKVAPALNLQIGLNWKGSGEGGRVGRKQKQYENCSDWHDYNISAYLWFRLAVITESTGLLVGRIHFWPTICGAVPVNKPWRGSRRQEFRLVSSVSTIANIFPRCHATYLEAQPIC